MADGSAVWRPGTILPGAAKANCSMDSENRLDLENRMMHLISPIGLGTTGILLLPLPISLAWPEFSVWLTGWLCGRQETYRLVQPRAGALDHRRGSVRDAGLLPSALLHFQREGGPGRERIPALKAELLARATPAA